MPTAFTRMLLSLLLLLPLTAHAGDAQDFVTANPAKQASLLERWSAAPDAARLPLLEALQQSRVATDSSALEVKVALHSVPSCRRRASPVPAWFTLARL